jgi:peptidoglycan/xylan/chitin deacetylase (PgdA/CDA1 family)
MPKITYCLVIAAFFLGSFGPSRPHTGPPLSPDPAWAAAAPPENSMVTPDYLRIRESMTARFSRLVPGQWGERIPGVITGLPTTAKVVALTFDACGTSGLSKGYDRDLIDFLNREQIPATLFLSSLWIDANPETAKALAANPLFEIENHGLRHRPCSVNGRSAYGLPGTENVAEVVDEVELSARKLARLTGKRPRFYRSGTAYYDEVAVQIVAALGYRALNYNVLGDAGATFKTDQVKKALLSAKPGSIVLCHMNHPEAETAEGVIAAVPEMRKMGFEFVRLDQYLPPVAP